MELISLTKEYEVKIPGSVLIIVFSFLVLSSTLGGELNIKATVLNMSNEMDNEVITNVVNRGSSVDWTFVGIEGSVISGAGGFIPSPVLQKQTQDRVVVNSGSSSDAFV